MKKLRKLSLKEELEKEAAEIEKELAEDPEVDNLKVSKELDDAIYAEIQRYEKEQEEDKIKEFPLRTYKKKKRAKLIVALVAILVLVMGMSVSSVGSKSYMKELIEKFTGKSQVDVTNVKDMDSKESNDFLEKEAYQKISNSIGKNIIRINQRPKGMYFQSVDIDENIKQAYMYYKYKNEIIRYEILVNYKDSSKGSTKEDEKIDEYIVETQGVKIRVEEHKVPEKNVVLQIAEYENRGISYQIKGVMKKEDIKKIIENLYFY